MATELSESVSNGRVVNLFVKVTPLLSMYLGAFTVESSSYQDIGILKHVLGYKFTDVPSKDELFSKEQSLMERHLSDFHTNFHNFADCDTTVPQNLTGDSHLQLLSAKEKGWWFQLIPWSPYTEKISQNNLDVNIVHLSGDECVERPIALSKVEGTHNVDSLLQLKGCPFLSAAGQQQLKEQLPQEVLPYFESDYEDEESDTQQQQALHQEEKTKLERLDQLVNCAVHSAAMSMLKCAEKDSKMVNMTQSPVRTPGVWFPLTRLTLDPDDVPPPVVTSGLVGPDNMSSPFLTVFGVPQDVNLFKDKPRSGDWSPLIFTAKAELRNIVPPTIAQCLLASTLSGYGDGCTHIWLISGIGKDEDGNYRFYGEDPIALTQAISTIKQCLIEWLPATSTYSIKAPQHHPPTDYTSRDLGQSLAAADVQQHHPQSAIEAVGEQKPTSQSRSDPDSTVSKKTNEPKANANDHPSSTDGVNQTGPEKKAAASGRKIIKKRFN